jgi:hypothetical protein
VTSGTVNRPTRKRDEALTNAQPIGKKLMSSMRTPAAKILEQGIAP